MKKTVKKSVAKAAPRITPLMSKEIDRRFDFVSDISEEKTAQCIALRAAHKKLAKQIAKVTPPGRERAMALTNLEQALFYTIAGIVRPTADNGV